MNIQYRNYLYKAKFLFLIISSQEQTKMDLNKYIFYTWYSFIEPENKTRINDRTQVYDKNKSLSIENIKYT